MILGSLLIIFTISPAGASMKLITNETIQDKFPSSIAVILARQFAHSYEAVLIKREFIGPGSNLRQLDLLNEVIRLIDGKLVVQFQSEIRVGLVRPWFYNWFIVDGYGSFRRIYEQMDYRKYEFSGYYLVTIAGEVVQELSDLIRKILTDLWTLDIFNVNVVVDGTTLIYTFFPYTAKLCGVVEPVLWERFSIMNEVDLYPERLKTFHGCTLLAGMLETKPYTIIRDQKHVQGFVVTGFEGDMMDLLTAKLNFSIRYKVSTESWGLMLEKGNSTGVMKMIQDEEVEFGVGCLAITHERNYWLKAGIAHYISEILLVVPAGRPFTAFEKLFRPFRVEIWFLITLFLITGSLTIGFLQCYSRDVRDFVFGHGNTAPVLNMMNIFYGGALSHSPKRNFARTLLLLWILFCFVIRNLYQGSLFQYLQRAMNHKPLETMDEIHRSGIPYLMMEIGGRYFTTMPHVQARTTFITPGKDTLGDTITMLGAGDVYAAVLTPLDNAAYHNKVYPKSQFVLRTRDHVAAFPVALYYPKKSHLKKVFDERMRQIQPAGLIQFWKKRYGDYDFFKKPSESREPRKLSNIHLAGGYQVFLGSLAISGIVFAIELLSVRLAPLRRLLLFIMD